MNTRKRGRLTHTTEEQSVEVDVCTNDLSSPTEAFPDDLDELFDNFKWTLETDSSLPFLDMELAEFGVYSNNEQDSGHEVSSASSPESSSGLNIRKRQSQSSHFNKNAIAARLNRMKKKEYLSSLEKKVTDLQSENNVLKKLTKRVEELEDETRYLRAVLANESMLGQLLSRLSGVSGMKLSSSLFQGPDLNDHAYALPRKRIKVEEKETSGGVCLHVDKNHVSVEFCTKCAESASTSLKM